MVMASLYFLQAFDGQRPMQVLCILKLIPPSVQDLSFDRWLIRIFFTHIIPSSNSSSPPQTQKY